MDWPKEGGYRMDTNMEEKMVRQIETKLSNHMPEDLFSTDRSIESKQIIGGLSVSSNKVTKTEEVLDLGHNDSDTPSIPMTRAEYIRQAREACLRQMNSHPQDSKVVNYVVEDAQIQHSSIGELGSIQGYYPSSPSEVGKEELAYRSLLIRSICCLVIFLFIFLFDKFDVNIGKFSGDTIREYIVNRDRLVDLENIIVSWFK